MYRPKLLLAAMLIVLCAAPVWASYDDAPWRATIIRIYVIRGESYTDTLQVWMDRGYRKSRTAPYESWYATQKSARMICTICTSRRLWPGEEGRYFAAKANSNLPIPANYHPLESFIYLPISISVHGSVPFANRPAWRYDSTDVVVLTLKDGRTYTSMPGIESADPHTSLWLRSGDAVDMCWQNKAMLGGRILYTADELPLLWQRNPLFKDRPTENTFLVPVDRGDDDRIELRDIVAIKLYLMGGWVDLQLQGALAERNGQR